MDQIIIRGIKQLCVLTTYAYRNMDELAQDLNHALEESSYKVSSPCRSKKGRAWKRRSKPCSALSILGSSIPKSSAVSEDSESSLDDRIRYAMEMSTNGSQPQSDSDHALRLSHNKHNLLSWRHCSTNIGESDSLNENFHPSREQRRKRKFKRMAVDPPSNVDHGLKRVVPIISQQTDQVHVAKLLKSMQKSYLVTDTENMCSTLETAVSPCGKRKRSTRERSIECCSYDNGSKLPSEKVLGSSDEPSVWSNQIMDYEIKAQGDGNSSGLSSSESECGVLTNDEGREGDDEQSDFFYEPGPVYGIPGGVPWWEEERTISSANVSDPNFGAIRSANFQCAPEMIKKMHRLQVGSKMVGRKIKHGRRRLH